MNDNRHSRPGDSQNDEFGDALDDIFGPAGADDTGDPHVEEPVVARTPEPTPAAAPLNQPPASSPRPHTPRPTARPQRSISRTIGIGCVVIVIIGFACTVILTVIGLLVDDDPGASAIDADPIVGNAAAVQQPTATEVSVEIPADLIPIGTYVELNSDWRAAVIATTPDATELVMAENQFNTPPVDGHQFFIATVSVENSGTETDFFPASFLFRAVGSSGTEYTTFDDFCGVIPDPFPTDQMRPGTSLSGNVCWSIAREDEATLVMRSDEFLGSYREYFFTLSR